MRPAITAARHVVSFSSLIGPFEFERVLTARPSTGGKRTFCRESSVPLGLPSEAIKQKHLRNRKHVPYFYRVIQTRLEVWENEKCCGIMSRRRVFPKLFRVLPNFHECLYNSIETRSTCFLFLLENYATRKRKTTC